MVKTLPSNAGGAGSIPGQEAEIPHASWPKNQNIKQKQYCNKFNKDFKNGHPTPLSWPPMTFFEERKTHPKIHMESQGIPNSQNNPEKVEKN